MRRLTVVGAAALVVSLATAALCAKAPASRPRGPGGHVAWVSESLRHMKTVGPGMTRSDLLKVFTTEGGISTAAQRTYVYQGCPYFKVDVQFRVVGRPERDKEGRLTSRKGPGDVITRISRPYLNWGIGR